jgi:hypothetical protein
MKDLNRHFSKGSKKVDKKTIKRYSTSLVIREFKIYTLHIHCDEMEGRKEGRK